MRSTDPTRVAALGAMPVSVRAKALAFLAAAVVAVQATSAAAEALLLVDADSGKVLHAENATYPWYPASVTKLMTTYVTLRAVKDRSLSLDKLITVSASAVAQQPSKMGFKAGIQLTVDNALKMMMVHSANDMAVVLAEGVGGSIENFVGEMNRTAQRLGMTQTSYVNPNGLPEDGQITSARDLAILARALIHDFPEYDFYWHIPAIKLGRVVMRNYNMLIDRFPGADGMKTGFICASGFNLVATATRNNRRLIAVVLGASSATARAEKAAQLLEKGFAAAALAWLTPSLGSVENLTPVAAEPPNLREEVCGKNRHRETSEDEPVVVTNDRDPSSAYSAMSVDLQMHGGRQASLLGPLTRSMPPVAVYVGPGRKQAARSFVPAPPAKPDRSDGETAKPAAAAATSPVPWNLFAPVPSADSAPGDLTAGTVPIPRPRPKQ
jgi:D-alanyl-D-alanine carboxypeptidase